MTPHFPLGLVDATNARKFLIFKLTIRIFLIMITPEVALVTDKEGGKEKSERTPRVVPAFRQNWHLDGAAIVFG